MVVIKPLQARLHRLDITLISCIELFHIRIPVPHILVVATVYSFQSMLNHKFEHLRAFLAWQPVRIPAQAQRP
jgi:hypothetical protein